VTITLNGRPQQVASESSVADLLAGMQIAVKHVAVEVNLEIVPRTRHAEHRLREGDRVEVVTLVGGG
jgi:sulfur carrier protein